ncbi:MAG TPA: hypothetical protein VG842_07445, partial [Sediminibacterium sp.]|nr:hypothetical protein [Sediminibacterium sp.]
YHFVYQVNGGAAQTIATATGNGVSLAVPTGTAGDFIYSLISVSDASSTSCSNPASGSATIRVKALPSALISGTTAVCQGSAAMVHLSGSGGTAPYLFRYQVNGASTQSILSDGDGNMDIPVPTNTAGILTYALQGVQDAGGNGCAANSGGTAAITVNGLPEAVISGTTAVCQNSASPMIHFAGSGGTPPYTFVYRVNGGDPLSVSTSAGSEVDIPVPTATPGVYAYSLVSITDGSSTACSNGANGTATVTIHALPGATLSGTTAVCQHTVSPDLLFTGTDGIAPYTFTYRVNDGANQTITTVSGNSVSLAAPTDVAGSFHYTLIRVQDGSSTSCAASVSGEATVTVYALPEDAVINTSEPHLCNGTSGSIRVLNYTQGNQYQWLYNGAPLRVTTGDTIMNRQSGRFTVRSVSAQGCLAAGVSKEVKITTGNVPAPVILGKTTICDSGMTKLIATNYQQPFEVWRWTDPPDSLHKAKIYGWDSSFFGHAGQYQVWVMTDGCYDSTLVTISANDTEYPAGRILLDKDSVEYGGRVLITADVSGANEYHWDLGNGKQFVSTDKTVAEHFYVVADSIAIQLKAVSAYNCQTDFMAFLKVLPPSPVVLKDASISGNLKDWNLFPIPFHDHLKLSVILERSEQIRLDMFTAEGKWVRSWIKKGNRGENLFPLEGVDQLPSQVVYYVTANYNGKKHFDTIIKY